MNIAPKIEIRRLPVTVKSNSLDRDARTVEAVLMTETPRERSDFRGDFLEKLTITKNAVDLSRLIGGPVLNNHNRRGHEDQIGVVDSARIKDGKVFGTLRFFTGAAGDEVINKIDEGMNSVSAGYIVEDIEESTDDDGVRTVTVTRSTPLEVSVVPIPLDPNAKIRSFEVSQTNTIQEERQKESDRIKELRSLCLRGREDELETAIRAGTSPADFAAKMVDAEKERAAEYLRARKAAEEDGAPKDIAVQNSNETLSNPQFRQRAMAAAIVQRCLPEFKAPPEAEAYRGWSFVDMAAECLEHAGVRTRGMRPSKIVKAALTRSSKQLETRAYGAHGSGDFIGTVGDAARQFLLERYNQAPAALKAVATQRNLIDYREHQSIRGSAFPELKPVNEHGEIKHGTITDAGEKMKLIRFGRIVGLTHEAMVNDAVGQFVDLMGSASETAIAQESTLLAEKVEENPAMADGENVFSSAHGNLAGVGALPDETTLSARRSAMRKQLGLNSERIAPTPRHFVVPPELETDAEKLVSIIQASKTDDANVFSNLSVLVEPRFTDATAWYLAADPAQVQGLRYGYLEEENGPVVDERMGWEIDGIEIRVRLSFAVGWVDFRGWQKNPGA